MKLIYAVIKGKRACYETSRQRALALAEAHDAECRSMSWGGFWDAGGSWDVRTFRACSDVVAQRAVTPVQDFIAEECSRG